MREFNGPRIKELKEERIRAGIRLKLFHTIVRGRNPEKIFSLYERRASIIVPPSVAYWAERQIDQEQITNDETTRKQALTDIFDADVKIGTDHSLGKTTRTLQELIGQERNTARNATDIIKRLSV